MRGHAVVLLAAGIGGLAVDGEVARGRRFEVRAPTTVKAARILRWAEETGKAFEDLVGSFPGKRAGINAVQPADVVRLPGGVRRDLPAPPPGLDWNLEFLPAYTGEVVGALVPRAPDEETYFRHVLGHRLLAEWTTRLPDGGPKPDGSGCALPDWFEEAVAVDMEPDVRKRDYLKAFGAFAREGKAWTVADLQALARPKSARKSPFAGVPEGPPLDLPEEVRRKIEEIRRRFATSETDDHAEGVPFEVQSWCLLEFLRREYGGAFLRHVAETLGANRGFGNVYPWIEKHRADLRDPKAKPPGTDRELDAAFLAWAKAR
jgi:hypothetical protein